MAVIKDSGDQATKLFIGARTAGSPAIFHGKKRQVTDFIDML